MSDEASKRRFDQAVLVIHGIGEQRPMSTIRGFVDAVLPEYESGPKFFSKPDSLSSTLEVRKLQNREQPRTHYYEYYWAYKVKGTRVSHTFAWLKSLLLRSPSKVPGQLQLLWVLSWILALATVGSFVAQPLSRQFGFELPSLDIPGGIALVLFGALQWVTIHYVGDAARYLSPNPKNITLRQKIRSDGLALLDKLCDPENGYSRVVVVGHSLGSVIAYDLLRHLWQKHHNEYKPVAENDQSAMKELEAAGTALHRANRAEREEARARFQSAQSDLWFEQRELKNPWPITDLITLGSPLAHGALLLAKDMAELRALQEERELPTCPPVPDNFKDWKEKGERYAYNVWEPYPAGSKKIRLRALHHAAHFACTRWTNLYFPVRNGIDGDFVGGPVAPVFGEGVKDVEVSTDSALLDATPFSHTRYWVGQTRSLHPDDNGRVDPVAMLRHIIEGKDFWEKLKRS